MTLSEFNSLPVWVRIPAVMILIGLVVVGLVTAEPTFLLVLLAVIVLALGATVIVDELDDN